MSNNDNNLPDTIRGSARVRLGHSELAVRPVGLGCMGMSQFYGPADDAHSVATIRTALDLGVDFLDTSDIYGAADVNMGAKIRGFGHNERLIGEASLRRLGVETIDLYYCHRIDPKVPVEETVGAMARLIEQGKVRAIGLSEASVEQLRRAHGVQPLTALQSEYSLWERGVEAEILPTCRELGITFVPFSPLARSSLTGALQVGASFAAGDFRASNPRFASENLATNLVPVETLKAIAESKGCRPGQLALAWLLLQPFDIVPIPGTKRAVYVEENLAATNVALSPDEIAYISSVFAPERIVGQRYAPIHAVHVANKK